MMTSKWRATRGLVGRWMAGCVLIVGAGGCKTATLSQAGSAVSISSSPPIDFGYVPASCESLGYLVGRGGGTFGGGYISNEKLIEYAMNDLRNRAGELGANYVQHDTPQLGVGGGENTTTTTATITGNAYLCKEHASGRGATSGGEDPSVATRTPASTATVPAMEVIRTPRGYKDLRQTLTVSGGALLLRAVPGELPDVQLVLRLPTSMASDPCAIALAADGERVAVQLVSLKQDDATSSVLRATMTREDLTRAGNATRLAGRACNHEFALGASEIAVIKTFAVAVNEAHVLSAPPPAPASPEATAAQ